jgi:hypothetical protein
MRKSPSVAREAAPLPDKIVHVECYAGYKGDERPVRLQLAGQMVQIAEIEDRW